MATEKSIQTARNINPLTPNFSKSYTLSYRSDIPCLISYILALWRSVLSAIVPECRKLKMVGQTCMALNLRSNHMITAGSKGFSEM